ncbi:S1C family serine protease [Oceanobacillus damuensis]|uniref:S1C family serine protease n=1 Tax=Oceanobacillus damuensis TaxID=937928 RepID=UPI000829B92D|nr:trypsin-like peptidase domain-containing protein [Oceanobacillus damuensis]
MGYYSDDYRKTRKQRRPWLIPLITGVVLGALLVLIVLPELFNMGGDTATQEENTEVQSNTDDRSINQTMQVDVSTQITEVVEEVTPSVVGITNIQRRSDFWQQQEGIEAGTGSGVIYKVEEGTAFVVTNHHVIEGADVLEVVLSDDTHLEAEIIGSDLFSDLAVLKMDGSNIPKVIEVGSSADIKVGEPAIAIGNPLGLYLSSTVTQGVISGTERTIPQDFNQDGRADWQAEVIQTDAAINPGNSGGALINLYGQLIGINSMKINQEAVEGIGFAIPIDSAIPIIEELEKTGEVVRPYLGVEIYSLDEIPHTEWSNTLNLPAEVEGGVYVWNVDPLSPADRADLKRLDVITELDGNQVKNMIDLRKILYQEKEIGDEVEITFYRDGERNVTTITLGTQ